MSAVRFPIAEGAVVKATEITHQSGYSRETRVAVRYIVAYWPANHDGSQTSVKMQGREQPFRLDITCDELDSLIAKSAPDASAEQLDSMGAHRG